VAADGTIYFISRAHFNYYWSYVIAVNPDLTLKWDRSMRNRFHDGCNVLLPPNGTDGGCPEGTHNGVDPFDNLPGSGRVTDNSTASPVAAPDGSVIYFTAVGDAVPAVFAVPAGGGATSTLAEGGPLSRPSGVAVATDGTRLFVADSQAANRGAVLVVPTTASGPPAAPRPPGLLPGTEGRGARGVDVVKGPNGDVVWFTGTDSVTNLPGLFSVPAAGGTVTTVLEGVPFVAPDSVVVAASGVAYVSDQGAGPGQGKILRVGGGRVEEVRAGLHLGAPAGVTLVDDDATLLVSSVDGATGSDQVLFVELSTGRTAAATKALGDNKNTSGGLHRAHDAAVLAWCDVNRSGKIYRIEP